MERPPLPLPLPLPRPGEAIFATAFAGALGLATWAGLPFLAVVPAFLPPVALVVAPFAFHWLRAGLVTAKNAPERGFDLPTSSTAVRIGLRAFAYGAFATGTLCSLIPVLFQEGGALAYRILVHFCVGATVGIVFWAPATLVALLGYGLPLRAATAAMDAAYPDVVDRALVRTHSRLAIGAALALVAGGFSVAFALRAGSHLQVSFTIFLLFGLAAVAFPARVAIQAQRRLAARNAWTARDVERVPIAATDAERLANLPILGTGTAPTHALVRVAAVGAYRSAATPEEPLALIAVPEEDQASRRSR